MVHFDKGKMYYGESPLEHKETEPVLGCTLTEEEFNSETTIPRTESSILLHPDRLHIGNVLIISSPPDNSFYNGIRTKRLVLIQDITANRDNTVTIDVLHSTGEKTALQYSWSEKVFVTDEANRTVSCNPIPDRLLVRVFNDAVADIVPELL